MTQSAGWRVEVIFFDAGMRQGCVSGGIIFGRVRGLAAGSGERLRLLASIAIHGYGFEAELPGLDVGFRDIVYRGWIRQVDGFGDGSGDERLRGSHHL